MSRMASFLAMCAGMQIIFNMGFVPTDEELSELTPEEYRRFYDSVATEEDRVSKERIYVLLPKDPKLYAKFAGEKALVFRETEVRSIKAGAETIEKSCKDSGKEFKTFDEKLRYCASVMPDVFSEGTKYARHHKDINPKKDTQK